MVKVCPVGVNVLVLGVMRKRIRITTKEVPHLSGSREAPPPHARWGRRGVTQAPGERLWGTPMSERHEHSPHR